MGVFVSCLWVCFLCVVFVCVNGVIFLGVFVGVFGVCVCVCYECVYRGCFGLGCGLGCGQGQWLGCDRCGGLGSGLARWLGWGKGLTPCHVAQPRPPPWIVLGRMARFTIGCGLNAPVALIN